MDIAFEVWTGQGAWFWYVVNPQCNGGTIGAASTETEVIRDARSSIEEISAARTRCGVAAHWRCRCYRGIQSKFDGILILAKSTRFARRRLL
jgi:hypothetical protein